LVIVAVPAAAQVGGVTDTVGVAGVGRIFSTVNDCEGAEVHIPKVAVTVYAWPYVTPVIEPPIPTVGPVGLNV
jgi:hypothetical protein